MKLLSYILLMYIWQLFNVDAKAQDLIFVAKVPFSGPSNLNWGKAIVIRGNSSTLDTFKKIDDIAPKKKKLTVPGWKNSFLLILEFQKSNKEELNLNSFTRVYVDGQKISFDLWGESKSYPNLDKLLELYPESNQKVRIPEKSK